MRCARPWVPVLSQTVTGRSAGLRGLWRRRAFEGFRHTVEHSVYVHNQHRGAGIGRLLMTELVERAKAGGIHVMVGCIEAENKASIRLHEALGFRHVGTFAQVGVKFGRWLDLTCMELRTGSGDPG